MKPNELHTLLDDCCNDFSFVVDGKPSGIIPEVADYKRTYHVWYGPTTTDFHDLFEVMTTPFWGGKSLMSICEGLDFQIS